MSAFLSWLATTKIGCRFVSALALLSGLVLMAAHFYAKGKAAMRSKHQRKTLEDIENRRKLDADIDRLDDDDIAKRMQDHWSR